jgi:hypothetical protein
MKLLPIIPFLSYQETNFSIVTPSYCSLCLVLSWKILFAYQKTSAETIKI